MKLGFSTNAYTDGMWTLEASMRRIAQAGYAGVTILADEPHLWVPTIHRRRLRSIRQTLSDTGLYVTNVNGFTAQAYDGNTTGAPGQNFGPIFSDVEKSRRDWKIDYTKQVIVLTSILGDALNVSIGSGYYPLGENSEDVWDWTRDAIAECVAYAAKYGVRLNIEPEPGMVVGDMLSAERLMVEIASASLGVNFDTGHFYAAGDDVVDAIMLLWPWINGVDLEDIRSTCINRYDPETGMPKHEHQVPGDGDMPLLEILEAFEVVEYDGWYTVELYNHSHHPEEVTDLSIERLRPMFETVLNGT